MRTLTRMFAGLLTVAAVSLLGGTALAAFPDFSGCTATDEAREICVNIQNRSGTLDIKGFAVPLGESLEIRGRLANNGTPTPDFHPPTGTTGFLATPVPVPGGLLGIDWIPGTSVLAITELAGSPSDIKVNVGTNSVRLPIKVRLVNLLLGMNCHIGTDRSPVVLNLITGRTSPPPPNTPISGRVGEVSFDGRAIVFRNNLNVDNTFPVPGATSCGLGLGLINLLVNARLQLPAAAGTNSIQVVNDVAIGLP